jgi:ribosomal protein S18 acetylase RimI-like enzyme
MALSNAVRWGGVTRAQEPDVWQVPGPHHELTAEIVRLFALDSHRDEMLEALGVGREEMAAYRFSTLAEPGGALFVADRSGRLEGLLYLVPECLQSAVLGHYIWSARQLVIAPGAPRGTVRALLEAALNRLEPPLDCVVARVPARDQAAICGLQDHGFQAVGSEVVGVLAGRTRPVREPPYLKLAPIQRRHLSKAADLMGRNGHFFSFSSSARVTRLYECLLAGYVEEPRAGGLVAEGPSGDLLGFITYRRRIWLGEFTRRRLASLDFFGVQPEMRSNGVGETLHRHALSALSAQSADAIEARVSVTDPGAAGKLKLLRKLGCRAFSSDLIFKHWVGRGTVPC